MKLGRVLPCVGLEAVLGADVRTAEGLRGRLTAGTELKQTRTAYLFIAVSSPSTPSREIKTHTREGDAQPEYIQSTSPH